MDKASSPSAKQNVSYPEILQSIGDQLKHRQSSIVKRVALTSLPLIIAVVALIFSDKIRQDLHFSDQVFTTYLVVFGILFLFALPWAVITNRIFRVERVIWIDSYFDKVALSDNESWRLAIKLFWPNVIISLLIFLRYYLILVVLWIAAFTLYGFYVSQKMTDFQILVYIIALIAIPLTFALYSFVVKVRLRYLLFVFLDMYRTPEFSYNSLFKEAIRINRVTKGDAFKKTLVTMLGAEAAENAINVVASYMISASTSQLGGTGQAAGAAVGMAASEVAVANRDYAEVTTFYIYYQVGRSILYGDSQKVNQNLYSLIK